MKKYISATGLFLCFIWMMVIVPGCNPMKDALLTVDWDQCINCNKCVTVCKADAVRIIEHKAVIDPTKCIKCGNCVEICPVNAIY